MFATPAAAAIASATLESRKLAGYMRLLATAQKRGNAGGVALSARKVQASADRIAVLLNAAEEWNADA